MQNKVSESHKERQISPSGVIWPLLLTHHGFRLGDYFNQKANFC